jgi:parallel beta-helix repeat protein
MIIAEGSVDDPIRFTSNRLAPNNGDWRTIIINGSTQSSFTNCIIEYGAIGITLENGALDVQDCLIGSNSENGIAIYDGYVNVRNNQIINNTVAGISIAGGGQVIIENNLVSSNGDGIVLEGYTVSPQTPKAE